MEHEHFCKNVLLIFFLGTQNLLDYQLDVKNPTLEMRHKKDNVYPV